MSISSPQVFPVYPGRHEHLQTKNNTVLNKFYKNCFILDIFQMHTIQRGIDAHITSIENALIYVLLLQCVNFYTNIIWHEHSHGKTAIRKTKTGSLKLAAAAYRDPSGLL